MLRKLALGVATAFVFLASANAQEVVVGSSYYYQIVPIGTTTILPATSNVRGVSVKTGNLSTLANQLAYLQADYPDGTHHPIFLANSSAGTNNFLNLPYPLYLPQGVGISAVYGPNSQGAVAITYDLH